MRPTDAGINNNSTEKLKIILFRQNKAILKWVLKRGMTLPTEDSCLSRDSTIEVYVLFCLTNGVNIKTSYILNLVMPAILDS